MKPAEHNCTNYERILELEKNVIEVQTTTNYLYKELADLKIAIQECTKAINDASNKITVQESRADTSKWFIMTIITVIGILIGYII